MTAEQFISTGPQSRRVVRVPGHTRSARFVLAQAPEGVILRRNDLEPGKCRLNRF